MIEKYQKRPKTPAVHVYPDGREVCSDVKAGKAEYLLRTFQMARRQRGLCGTCGLPLGDDVTFGHSRSRGMNGGFRDDRLVVDGKWNNAALHWKCNGLQGSRAYEWRDNRFQPVERKDYGGDSIAVQGSY